LLDSKKQPSISLRKSYTPCLPDYRSFKYVLGSTTLDTRRPAAYTDRVLYTTPSTAPSSTPGAVSMVTAGTYTSHDILWSDHRPVTCDLQVQVRVADEEKRKADLVQVRSDLDKLDEEWAPSIEVDQLEVDFGDTRYGVSRYLADTTDTAVQSLVTWSCATRVESRPHLTSKHRSERRYVCRRFKIPG